MLFDDKRIIVKKIISSATRNEDHNNRNNVLSYTDKYFVFKRCRIVLIEKIIKKMNILEEIEAGDTLFCVGKFYSNNLRFHKKSKHKHYCATRKIDLKGVASNSYYYLGKILLTEKNYRIERNLLSNTFAILIKR